MVIAPKLKRSVRMNIEIGLYGISVLLMVILLPVSCKMKPQDVNSVQEDNDYLYEYDEHYETTPEVAAWLQRIPIDSAEHQLCRHKGQIQLGDSTFTVWLSDVLRCCPDMAMNYPFEELAESMDMTIRRTDDGRLRFFYWNTGMGGTCPDIARYTLLKDDAGKVHLMGRAHECPQLIDIYTLKTRKGETVYLLHDYFREWSSYGAAWVWGCRIKGHTLDTLALFPHGEKSVGTEYSIPGWYFSANDGEGWGWLFELHGDNLYVPVVIDDGITDRYDLYRWNGSTFDSVGNVGNRRLHPSLQHYYELSTYFITKGFRVRIDQMPDGSYRYASWPRSRETSTKPDLIIYGGRYDDAQSCYLFENDGYIYKVGVYSHTSDRNTFRGLTVEKAGKVLLQQAKE